MVKGLDIFRERLGIHTDQYILIGGAACDLIMGEVGLEFRATKDLDIVLCVEALDVAFGRAFWEFVREGRYQVQNSSSGERRYYRFQKPERAEYPYMLELFSRRPDLLQLSEGAHLTPVPMDEEISSLSAILLDDVYYEFIHAGKRMIEGITVVGVEHLLPLKVRAWLDLTSRKRTGATVQSHSISKHKNDVFRLYQVLDPAVKIDLPMAVRDDMRTFLNAMESQPVDLKNLGIRTKDLGSILAELRESYVHD